MNRLLNTGIIFMCCLLSAKAQVTLSGIVMCKETGERLPDSHIGIISDNNFNLVVCNSFGYFSTQISNEKHTSIQVSHIAYEPYELEVPRKDTLIQIYLTPQTQLLSDINIEAPVWDKEGISTYQVRSRSMKELPFVGGEPDIIKVLQLYPGIKSGVEGSSGMYVRGGTPDQNLILLDDVPVFNVNHLGGFISLFNPDIIGNAKIITGGFPAKYGGRLSSVTDIRLKDGHLYERKISGTVGIPSSRITVEGPIQEGKASYIVSYRRCFFDLLSIPASKLMSDGLYFGYNFFDVNAKVNYSITPNDRIYLSLYAGDDRFITKVKNKDINEVGKSRIRWGNGLAALKWTHIQSSNCFINTTLTYSRYRFVQKDISQSSSEESFNTFTTSVKNITGAVDVEYSPFNSYRIRTGGKIMRYSFMPVSTRTANISDGYQLVNNVEGLNEIALDAAAYIENMLTISPAIDLNAGVRYYYFKPLKTQYSNWEPRLVFNYRLNSSASLNLAYTQMTQSVHLLVNDGIGLPIDYWMPSTEKVKPGYSEQVCLGYSKTTGKSKQYFARLETYYKTMKNLIAFKEGNSNLWGVTDWESTIETGGTGVSYGLEAFVEKRKGKTTGWVSYTLAETTRQFENINKGQTYPFKYDRRHDFNIVITHKLRKNIDFSATWVFHTGNAFTMPIGKYYSYFPSDNSLDDLQNEALVMSSKNAYRMKSYHRMDVGVNLYRKKEWGEAIWHFNIFNVYANSNPYFYYWDTDNDNNPRLFQQSLFPFFPSVSYSFKF